VSETTEAPGTLTHPLANLATALRVLLMVAAVLSAGLAYLAVRMRTELDEVDRADELAGNAANDAVDAFFNGLSLFFLILVGIGGLFVLWMYRAARNNQSFDRPGALGPGWAIGSWFIPLGSLALPAIQLQQIWRGADGSVPRGDPRWRGVRASAQLWVWWVSYVLAQSLTFVGFTLIGGTDDTDSELTASALLDHLDDVRTGVTLFVAGQVLMVLAATLGAVMVVRLSSRQEAAATALGPVLPGSVPRGFGRPSPAAWHPDPMGRFDLRWWDGRLWTEHVTEGGRQAVDPIDDD
jgi:Domain of unknown function (DUF4328)/Protein of unknown function (DUF2510)